ncbi:beta-porphyranase D [Flavobacterium fluviatile]|uniref:beta-porphyranase D n=1 Tax=Flavobacterium fluviatile TaxID=1862387 RepID=UPI0013D67D99|nr:beta-porphyranase D [Flavobacterium fluviatile]
MSIKRIMILLAFANLHWVQSQTITSGPPEPPLGKRWVLNPELSDEFNGTQIDTTKWFDYHPQWKGRVPGLFLASQVSVKDGFLQIKGEKMKKDTLIKNANGEEKFTIAGGAVVSKKTVLFGYYESRIKAAATTMSATFWFSTNGKTKSLKECDKYSLEWDIHESIGRNGPFEGSYFANGMHSNSHYWYTDCNGEVHDYRAPQVVFQNAELSSENFNVYGGWWRDEQTASYYYNNGEPKHQKFYSEINKKPFDRPMHMRLVSETYPFPWIELPNDAELADPTKNTVYYDWVRAYKLVEANMPIPSSNNEPVIPLFNEQILFHAAIINLVSKTILKIPIQYKAIEDREILLKLSDPEGKLIKETKFIAYTGYANLEYDMRIDKKLEPKSGYSLLAIIRPLNTKDPVDIDSSTLIINLKSK